MFFNPHASEYDRWYDSLLGKFADEVETAAAFELLKLEPGMSVLDIGCGTGIFSIKLARRGADVTGVDIADKMLSIAEDKAEKASLTINFLNMNIYNLDFAASSFDVVVSMAAFEFIKNPEKAFSEMIRVVKPGGQILIGTINKDSAWGKLYEQSGRNPDSVFSHAEFKTPEDLKQLAPEYLTSVRECLFVPPDSKKDGINREEESRLSLTEKGGFIAALWKKS